MLTDLHTVTLGQLATLLHGLVLLVGALRHCALKPSASTCSVLPLRCWLRLCCQLPCHHGGSWGTIAAADVRLWVDHIVVAGPCSSHAGRLLQVQIWAPLLAWRLLRHWRRLRSRNRLARPARCCSSWSNHLLMLLQRLLLLLRCWLGGQRQWVIFQGLH